MALGIDFGTVASGDGDTLFAAFTKINNMFTTTTKLGNGDMSFGRDGGITVGKGGGSSYGGTALGQDTLANATGADNTAIGWSALNANSTGNYNTAVGSSAMRFATGSNANSNVAIGVNSLKNTTGGNNTALGFDTLKNNTSGYENIAIGAGALGANLGGYYNTAIGSGSQVTSIATTGNVSLGNYSLYNANAGNGNTAVGYGALQNNSSGASNTAIGYAALLANTTFNNVIGIGAYSVVTGDNELQLGATYNTVYSQAAVVVRSDLRDKTEVRDTILGLDFINELRPVDYKWDMREDYKSNPPAPLGLDATEQEKEIYKIVTDEWLESVKIDNLTHDGTHTRSRFHHGLIAQEVQDVIEASGVDFGGFQDHKANGGQDVLSLRYEELIAPMIKAIQELTARINVLEGN
jgi:hypothetical protein